MQTETMGRMLAAVGRVIIAFFRSIFSIVEAFGIGFAAKRLYESLIRLDDAGLR
ncbi:MAG: hypothetical protein RBS99_07205 [Rhodospirillales bacterium]|jgi:hypothetical protein|nr:hypothetical protein [Rhodospirillales bacterium]